MEHGTQKKLLGVPVQVGYSIKPISKSGLSVIPLVLTHTYPWFWPPIFHPITEVTEPSLHIGVQTVVVLGLGVRGKAHISWWMASLWRTL